MHPGNEIIKVKTFFYSNKPLPEEERFYFINAFFWLSTFPVPFPHLPGRIVQEGSKLKTVARRDDLVREVLDQGHQLLLQLDPILRMHGMLYSLQVIA